MSEGVKKFAFIKRIESFSAAHRLHSHFLDADENRKLYGKCNNIHGHGHNYKLEVTLKGEVDPKTGMVMNIVHLKAIIQDEVMQKLDHKNLDVDVPYFSERPSTSENIAMFIWDCLKERLGSLLYEIVLFETDKNVVIYRGEGSN